MKIPIVNIDIDDDNLKFIYMFLMLSSVMYLISQVDANERNIQYILYLTQQGGMAHSKP